MTVVVLADASPLVRVAARAALGAAGIDVASDVGDARDAVRAAGAVRPEVVLLDAGLPGWEAAISEIRATDAGTAIVVLSPDDSDTRAMAAIRAGACGFLPKDIAPERLPAIVRGAAAGEAAISRRLVRRMLTALTGQAGMQAAVNDGLAALTDREREIIDLLSRGLSDRLVAERLGVSEITVRRHAGGAARKLRAPRRDEALATYRRLVA